MTPGFPSSPARLQSHLKLQASHLQRFCHLQAAEVPCNHFSELCRKSERHDDRNKCVSGLFPQDPAVRTHTHTPVFSIPNAANCSYGASFHDREASAATLLNNCAASSVCFLGRRDSYAQFDVPPVNSSFSACLSIQISYMFCNPLSLIYTSALYGFAPG